MVVNKGKRVTGGKEEDLEGEGKRIVLATEKWALPKKSRLHPNTGREGNPKERPEEQKKTAGQNPRTEKKKTRPFAIPTAGKTLPSKTMFNQRRGEQKKRQERKKKTQYRGGYKGERRWGTNGA